MLPTTIEINETIDGHCGPIHGDRVQIEQILMNLATNAFYAMRDHGGRLEIGLAQIEFVPGEKAPAGLTPGSYARLSVCDTGVGMDDDTQRRIFDPYFTTRQGGDGTGLGLSTVHAIVGKCQGAIEVVSAPGAGTRFEILLPISDSRDAAQPRPCDAAEEVPGGNERIMLVDDEQAIVDVLRQALERLGYEIIPFTDSTTALKAFQDDPQFCDLVVTDQTMPTCPGETLAKEMLAIRPELPIILTTGYSDRVDEERAGALGVRAFRTKPVDFADLARVVRTLLDA
jgi:CheY-like chemotaxis protein